MTLAGGQDSDRGEALGKAVGSVDKEAQHGQVESHVGMCFAYIPLPVRHVFTLLSLAYLVTLIYNRPARPHEYLHYTVPKGACNVNVP